MNDGVTSDGPVSGPAYKRSSWMLMISLPVALLFSTALLLSGCGQDQAPAAHATDAADKAATLPPGVMPAARACKLVIGKPGTGFFTDPKQVHLVLTSYAKGEPVESQGDISYGMPPQTLVWVVEVHAKAVNWDHSTPPGYKPGPPGTDFSVVLNAKTGAESDQGECDCWPLPLSTVGSVVSLPPTC
jgi:hypothetical protein